MVTGVGGLTHAVRSEQKFGVSTMADEGHEPTQYELLRARNRPPPPFKKTAEGELDRLVAVMEERRRQDEKKETAKPRAVRKLAVALPAESLLIPLALLDVLAPLSTEVVVAFARFFHSRRFWKGALTAPRRLLPRAEAFEERKQPIIRHLTLLQREIIPKSGLGQGGVLWNLHKRFDLIAKLQQRRLKFATVVEIDLGVFHPVLVALNGAAEGRSPLFRLTQRELLERLPDEAPDDSLGGAESL